MGEDKDTASDIVAGLECLLILGKLGGLSDREAEIHNLGEALDQISCSELRLAAWAIMAGTQYTDEEERRRYRGKMSEAYRMCLMRSRS